MNSRIALLEMVTAVILLNVSDVDADTIRGQIVDDAGGRIGGVMVSAVDEERRQSVSVFSQEDGSFAIDGLRDTEYTVRARLMGRLDEWLDDVPAGSGDVSITMRPATGIDLEDQRPADSAFSMLEFDSMADKENFKMMCSYCHQVGTIGFRTPEKPVDWETMLRRMDGFGGLFPHTQETIVQRLMDTYKDDAIESWPEFVPPPPPTGTAAQARITEWELGDLFEGSFHDLELGPDGLVYAVNISKHYVITLDPETGEQEIYPVPQGTWGPHSIELANDGHMWITMCASGQMAKFDVETHDYTICSSAEAPAPRGAYPHTLRINPEDPEGLIWYTDAGSNSCYWVHPESLEVKEYPLLSANQAVAAGKGESRGITPYGLDYSPVDGSIWYSKLNGNRIGRIDPNAEDGDVREWNPPFRGPRRLHVARDGMVWVPGFGSGVFAKFDPFQEEWTVYDLPNAENQIPYALNIDPKGFVWICGTGNDTLNRFDPRTEELVEFRLPRRVSYTREIEFDADGNVWTSTSGPARHMEGGCGTVIKLEILGDDTDSTGGIQLAGRRFDGDHDVEVVPVATGQNSRLAELLARIDASELPKEYDPGRGANNEERARIHQDYVDRRMEGLTDQQRGRVGQLWREKERIDANMPNRGASFVRIMEYVANGGELRETSRRDRPMPAAPAAGDDAPGISGVIRFDGTPPERQQIRLRGKNGELSDCHELHDQPLLDENVLVSVNGEVANVFVYVKRGVPEGDYPVPEEPALLDQKKCMFTPRVQGVRIGQAFLMRNSDPVLHNVRSLTLRNRPFNVAQPPDSDDRDRVFTRRERAVRVQCDIHPWMRAYYFVMEHPFYAVTDENGRFNIPGLPTGEYTLTAWHEEFGEQEAEVTVGEDGLATADFTFGPEDAE